MLALTDAQKTRIRLMNFLTSQPYSDAGVIRITGCDPTLVQAQIQPLITWGLIEMPYPNGSSIFYRMTTDGFVYEALASKNGTVLPAATIVTLIPTGVWAGTQSDVEAALERLNAQALVTPNTGYTLNLS